MLSNVASEKKMQKGKNYNPYFLEYLVSSLHGIGFYILVYCIVKKLWLLYLTSEKLNINVWNIQSMQQVFQKLLTSVNDLAQDDCHGFINLEATD